MFYDNYVCKIVFHTFKQHVVTINKLSHYLDFFFRNTYQEFY